MSSRPHSTHLSRRIATPGCIPRHQTPDGHPVEKLHREFLDMGEYLGANVVHGPLSCDFRYIPFSVVGDELENQKGKKRHADSVQTGKIPRNDVVVDGDFGQVWCCLPEE